MTMRDRIRQRIEELETSVNAVQESIKSDFLKQFLLGRTKGMNTDNLVKLAKALDTTPEWLLEGRGETDADKDLQEIVSFWGRLTETHKKNLSTTARAFHEQSEKDKTG